MRDMIQRADKNWLLTWAMNALFVCISVVIAQNIAQSDFMSAAPIMLGISVFVIARFAMKRPFHQSLALYMAVVALNYYYFYCAGLTGRDPTDIGIQGTPATFLEKAQKDILFFLMLVLAGVNLVSSGLESRPIWAKKLNHPLMKMIFLFMAFSVLRSLFYVFEGDSPLQLFLYLRTNVEFTLIPLLLCTTLITREKQVRLIFKGLFYSLPIVAVLGIIEVLIGGTAYNRNFYGGELFARAASTLQNPNNLGAFLVTAMGIYIIYFFSNKLLRWERTMFWLALPVGFICLFMTMSRSSMFAFFLALTLTVIVLFLNARKEMGRERYELCRKLMLSYVFVLLISIYVLYRYFDFSNAVYDAFELYVQSSVVSNTRFYAVFPTLFYVMDNPVGALFGYSQASLEYSVDNAYAMVLVRNGIIGALIFGAFWVIAMRRCLSNILDKSKRYSFLYLVCFYILLFQIIFGFTATIHENFPHNLYFWLAIGTLIWLESPFVQARDAEANRSEVEALDVIE